MREEFWWPCPTEYSEYSQIRLWIHHFRLIISGVKPDDPLNNTAVTPDARVLCYTVACLVIRFVERKQKISYSSNNADYTAAPSHLA